MLAAAVESSGCHVLLIRTVAPDLIRGPAWPESRPLAAGSGIPDQVRGAGPCELSSDRLALRLFCPRQRRYQVGQSSWLLAITTLTRMIRSRTISYVRSPRCSRSRKDHGKGWLVSRSLSRPSRLNQSGSRVWTNLTNPYGGRHAPSRLSTGSWSRLASLLESALGSPTSLGTCEASPSARLTSASDEFGPPFHPFLTTWR